MNPPSVVIGLWLIAAPLFAQFGAVQGPDPSQPELLVDVSAVQPGGKFTVAVKFTIENRWHIYWLNSGASGLPTSVDVELPEGFEAGPVLYQTPKQFETAGQLGYGYEKEAWFLIPVTAPGDLGADDAVGVKVTVGWLSCNERTCGLPQNQELNLQLPVGVTVAPSPHAADIDAARKKMPLLPENANLAAAIEGGELVATLELPGQSFEAKDLELLPAESGIVTPGEPQNVEVSGGRAIFRLPLAEDVESLPERFEALVKLGGGQAIFVSGTGESGESAPKTQANEPEPETQPVAGLEAQKQATETMLSWGTVGKKSFPLPLVLISAFFGGVILNLMPCVFPVLGIKIMGFVQQAGEDTASVRRHGLVFGLGVLVSLWILAFVIIGIKMAGDQVLWGFQLQNPVFVVAMVVILFVFGLNLAGVFEFGMALTGAGQELQQREGYAGSFFSGVLAVVIATPCTGPFMAWPLTLALSSPAYITLLIFTLLGLGLAFPYVLLSFIPALIQKLPKPGPWMETFKQFMAFPMFATVVWLTSVYARLAGNNALTYFLHALVILAMGVWIYGRYAVPFKPIKTQWIGRIAALLFLAAFLYLTRVGYANSKEAESLLAHKSEIVDGKVKKFGIVWEPFSPVEVVRHRQKKRTVFIDFTADW